MKAPRNAPLFKEQAAANALRALTRVFVAILLVRGRNRTIDDAISAHLLPPHNPPPPSSFDSSLAESLADQPFAVLVALASSSNSAG